MIPKYLQRLSFKCDYCAGDFILGQQIEKWEDAEGLIYHIHMICRPAFQLMIIERFEGKWDETKVKQHT